jgi:hypothetical protein
METKNRKQKNNKNIYLDSFLKREITLSPKAYNVFLEQQKFPHKFIAIRESFTPTIYQGNIKKTIEKEINQQKNKVKFSKNINNLKDILEEKADLSEDFEDSNKGLEAEDYEDLDFKNNKYSFNKAIPKRPDFDQNLKPRNSKIAIILGSNILWFIITISLVISCILFYFQGLQPLILSKYSQNAQDQTIKLNNRFFEQVEVFYGTQNIILNRFEADSSLLCSKTPLYQEFNTDSDSLSRLQTRLFPDKRLEKLPNYNIFYKKDIQKIYTQNYTNYKDSLESFNLPATDLQNLIKFLNYRNNWITTCSKIETANSTKNFSQTQAACVDLIKIHKNYLDGNSFPILWSSISKEVENGINLCQNLQSKDLNIFFTNWFAVYSKIIITTPNFSEYTKENQEKVENFEAESKSSIKNISKINESKNGFTKIWYLMDLEFKK